MFVVPDSALSLGFLNDPVSAHGSRTIMLKELRLLLAACPRSTSYEEFRTAVLHDNVLLKNTNSTRQESFRRLRELYAINENVILFRALRDLWETDEAAQPLLALLCATARDSILRATADLILSLSQGDSITPQMIEKIADETFPERYNPTSLANIGRHAASSWQQSGHLKGRNKKIRVMACSQPATAAYALFLGYLCGERGEALFHTFWCHLLDASLHTLHAQAQAASQLGWLEYRHSGTITDITFRYLLREEP